MYVKKETEYQLHPVIVKLIEDLVGGCTIAADDLAQSDELAPGALVALDSNGLGHVVKTAKVYSDVGAAVTAIPIHKGSELKVGDVVFDTGKTLAAEAIATIDTSNADYDVLNLNAAIGALTAGDLIIQAAAQAAAGSGAYKYTPKYVTMSLIDLSVGNQQTGLLKRGTVNNLVMPYPIDATLDALMPLIDFEL